MRWRLEGVNWWPMSTEVKGFTPPYPSATKRSPKKKQPWCPTHTQHAEYHASDNKPQYPVYLAQEGG